ncbi:MAG: DUF4910 domain-containing protein, partial [Aestuariivirgaceae bacterium]
FVVTCVGDDGDFSFIPSRQGTTLADRIARNILKTSGGRFNEYSFLDRGSDERQFCSPLIDLPVASITRSKYATYDEYHTSGDNLDFISQTGLKGSFEIYKKCLQLLEANKIYQNVFPCEPQLGKRGLYPTLSTKESGQQVHTMMNVIAYADGKTDLLELSAKLTIDPFECAEIAERLVAAGVLSIASSASIT